LEEGKLMSLIIQKYGGSSVANTTKLKNAARRIAATKDAGSKVVVVVSAMGDTTDRLVKLAYNLTKHPPAREYDILLSTGETVSSTLLAMALEAIGCRAVSLSGAQAGIKTDTAYNRARILGIDTKRIVKELEKGKIVVVAGFQGITEDMDTTTLGRGGSDTTAVALAAGLGADECQVYTDVEGIYTADPRLIPQARRLREIDYEEMLELATYGAKVMHPRAVELGKLYNIPILVASSFTNNPGTLIHGGVTMEVRNKVSGITHDLNVAKITVVGIPDRPGIASSIFEPLAEAGISVDTIVQNASVESITDLTFTVTKGDLVKAMDVIKPIAKSIDARHCASDAKLGKISVIGTGMQNTPGFAARMFSALSRRNINIELITTSEIRITCIINETKVNEAVSALHRAFKLEQLK
jgi:aspartate kinase